MKKILRKILPKKVPLLFEETDEMHKESKKIVSLFICLLLTIFAFGFAVGILFETIRNS